MVSKVLKNGMRASILMFVLLMMGTNGLYAQAEKYDENTKQELLDLSKQKWQWMADKNADALADLFHDESVFVHMGGSWGKEQEVGIIRGGGIHYKHAEIHETSVRFVGDTAIILDRITLTAAVGGNEVVNPFIVTEVYVPIDGKWELGSLSFTRLAGQ